MVLLISLFFFFLAKHSPHSHLGGHVETSGDVWDHLEPSGDIWSHREPSGSVWFSNGVSFTKSFEIGFISHAKVRGPLTMQRPYIYIYISATALRVRLARATALRLSRRLFGADGDAPSNGAERTRGRFFGRFVRVQHVIW